MPAKAKGVAKYGAYIAFLGFVEGKVQFLIKVGIICKVIDRGGDKFVGDCQYADDGFHCACGAKQVAGHRLGGADIQLVGIFSKNLLDGFDF